MRFSVETTHERVRQDKCRLTELNVSTSFCNLSTRDTILSHECCEIEVISTGPHFIRLHVVNVYGFDQSVVICKGDRIKYCDDIDIEYDGAQLTIWHKPGFDSKHAFKYSAAA